jgi:ABC-type sugar transport system permease subunit
MFLVSTFNPLRGAFCIALVVNRFKGFAADFFRSAYFLPTVIPLFLT